MSKKRRKRRFGPPEAVSAVVGHTPLRSHRHVRRTVRLLTVVAILAAAALVALRLLQSGSSRSAESPRAAILDELAQTDPNPGFVQQATQMLRDAGYAVDYYPSDRVTVRAYQKLAARGYKIVLVRSHTAMHYVPNKDRNAPLQVTGDVDLFTSQPYSTTAYVSEQLEHRVDPAVLLTGRKVQYFSVSAEFVLRSMHGHFRGTTVILMGCDGLMTHTMADALIKRGAATVIGWDKGVTPSHTDKATLRLLMYLLVKHLRPKAAVAQTMRDVGPDPLLGARLAAYP